MKVWCLVLRVCCFLGSLLMVSCLSFFVFDLLLRVERLGIRVQGLGIRVQGSGCRVYGAGVGVGGVRVHCHR